MVQGWEKKFPETGVSSGETDECGFLCHSAKKKFGYQCHDRKKSSSATGLKEIFLVIKIARAVPEIAD